MTVAIDMNQTNQPPVPEYRAFLDEIKQRIRGSRLQVARAANRQFYLEYRNAEFLQQLVAEIPWGQNLLIMAKVKEPEARLYYLQATRDMGWTRAVLLHNIRSQAWQRHHVANNTGTQGRTLQARICWQDELLPEPARRTSSRTRRNWKMKFAVIWVQSVKQMSSNNAELKSVSNVKPLRRMVIDLKRTIDDPKHYDIALRDQDALVIPARKQAVTVVGEVQFATSHLYDKNLNANDYIERSGGTTMKADKKRVYVVKANGRVFLPRKSGWFRKNDVNIEPGDTVIVPLDADRIKSLTLWTSAAQIFYQIALGAAAVASF